MNLAHELNQQISSLADQAHKGAELAALRSASRALLAAKLLPEKFSEAWKYTKLRALEDGHLQQQTPAASAPENLPVFGEQAPLVIVNGRLPDTLPHWPGVTLSRLDHSASQLGDTTFALLNGATLEQGVKLSVANNAQPDALLHVIFYSSGATPSHHNTRLVIELGEGSRLQLVEQYLGQGPVLTNAVTEITAHANSELVHCRLQAESADSLHIGQLLMRQQRSSRIHSFQFMSAAKLKRNDVKVLLDGEGAELSMAGAFIATDKGHVDNQVCVEHRVPHCVSTQSYKGIAGDTGRAIFNGRIHILPGATKTNADLSNKNLLLSLGAEIDSKPELEIYNDDVKCSHGTTIGQIDPVMRFYLQSRGIDADSAQRMLSIGFIQEELNKLPFAEVAEWVSQWLGQAVTEAAK